MIEPSGQELAVDVVRQALEQLAPRELPVMEPFIEPMVEMASGGEPVALEVLRGYGRFGDADELLTLLLVPLVVGALRDQAPVTAQRVEEVARRSRTPQWSKRSDQLAECIGRLLQVHRERR